MPGVSKAAFWIGWILCILPAGLLLFSASGKFMMPPEAKEGFAHLGWPTSAAIPLGITEVACVLFLLIPRTAVLGAILLTGYMGGAIATHARIGEPFIVQALLPIVVWVGLYLRDPRLRQLAPLRSL
jgi:uncharacterized membrane protein YphA (DoxX/SURF4 family)